MSIASVPIPMLSLGRNPLAPQVWLSDYTHSTALKRGMIQRVIMSITSCFLPREPEICLYVSRLAKDALQIRAKRRICKHIFSWKYILDQLNYKLPVRHKMMYVQEVSFILKSWHLLISSHDRFPVCQAIACAMSKVVNFQVGACACTDIFLRLIRTIIETRCLL